MARQLWIRGPPCGIENCRSRLYRTQDGLTICQYGHVQEGSIEFDDDADQPIVTTRRLNAVALDERGHLASQSSQRLSQDKRKQERLFGDEARPVYYRCLQKILKHQLDAILNLFYGVNSVEKDLTLVVKTNWCRILNLIFDDGDEQGQRQGQQQQEQQQQEQEQVQEQEEDKERGASKRSRKHRVRYKRRQLDVLDLVCIIYISSLQLQANPLYLSDVLDCIRNEKIPFFKTYHLLPQEDLNVLGQLYFPGLQGYEYPLNDHIYKRLYFLNTSLVKMEITVPVDYYFLLIYKTLTDILHLTNAPQVFLLIYNLLKAVNKTKFVIKSDMGTVTKLRDAFPEVYIMSIVIFVLELNQKFDQQIFIRRQDTKDDIYHMSVEHTEQYCDWVYNNILPGKLHDSAGTQDLSMMEKRLFQIFDMNAAKEDNLETDTEKSSSSGGGNGNGRLMTDQDDTVQVTDPDDVDAMLFDKLSKMVNMSLDDLRKVFAVITKLFKSSKFKRID